VASGANAPPVHGIKKCLVYNDISLYKEGTFHHKKGTFHHKKGTFHHKKGTFSPFSPPVSYAPGFNYSSSSCPKEKNRTPSGQKNEGAKANHPVYSSVDVGQEIAHEDIE
jgi:hypothetical protein